MSGGSYDYIYSRLEEECAGRMYDAEMNDMIKDLCQVLHDLEWWQSSDYSENEYRATLDIFKAKWFKGNREERLKGYIDNQIGILRKQLYALIGEPTGAESEKQMQPERDCVNCVYSKDGHISFSETCHNCIWENQFIPKFMPKRIKASDIKPDDEWMQENEWDEIYKAESEEA